MGKPIVLYENLATYPEFGAVTPSDPDMLIAEFPAINVLSPFTFPSDCFMFNRRSTAGGSIMALDYDVSASFDSIALIIYGTDGEDVVVKVQDGNSPYTTRHEFTISADGVYLERFASLSAGEYRVRIETESYSSDSSIIVIPVLMLGAAMEFEKCIMKSYAPLDYNRATEYLTNESGTGQFMGRSIVRRNHESSVSFDLMSAAWVRSTFQPFVRHARTKPYFFAWNYDDYPDEVNYVWTDEDIGVSYTGDRDKMSASWKMRGLGNDPE